MFAIGLEWEVSGQFYRVIYIILRDANAFRATMIHEVAFCDMWPTPHRFSQLENVDIRFVKSILSDQEFLGCLCEFVCSAHQRELVCRW
jgi:hypothetical protein